MKRVFSLIILASLAVLGAACKKNNTDPNPIDPLSISFSEEGNPVSLVEFGPAASDKGIRVNVNREGLAWSVESNQSWCHILPGEHRGSGLFHIQVDANESFEARQEAKLTFVAGDFRDSSLTVIQKGSAFLVAQPYIISPRTEDDVFLDVTTKNGTQWHFEYNEWINIEEINSDSDDDTKTVTLKIWAADNDGQSRYGHITFQTTSGESYDLPYFQFFGEDSRYDADGNIFFPKDQDAEISFIAPEYVINQINVPDYATTTTEDCDSENGAVSVTIKFAENTGDSNREISVSLVLNNAAATVISLPKMIQE